MSDKPQVFSEWYGENFDGKPLTDKDQRLTLQALRWYWMQQAWNACQVQQLDERERMLNRIVGS